LEVLLARKETGKKGKGKAYEVVADKYENKDARSVSNAFGRRYSFWEIEGLSQEELQNAIANHREVLGK
jgi:hypothetical protein